MIRNITCLWGGRTCLGYTNKLEKENYCDHPDVVTTFCASKPEQNYVMKNKTRKFRWVVAVNKWRKTLIMACFLYLCKCKVILLRLNESCGLVTHSASDRGFDPRPMLDESGVYDFCCQVIFLDASKNW